MSETSNALCDMMPTGKRYSGNQENASYKSGDYIRCQVKREEQGEKGAVLGAKITLPGRYAIFVEGIEGYKFSNKLDKRQRAEIMQKLPPQTAEVIL